MRNYGRESCKHGHEADLILAKLADGHGAGESVTKEISFLDDFIGKTRRDIWEQRLHPLVPGSNAYLTYFSQIKTVFLSKEKSRTSEFDEIARSTQLNISEYVYLAVQREGLEREAKDFGCFRLRIDHRDDCNQEIAELSLSASN